MERGISGFSIGNNQVGILGIREEPVISVQEVSKEPYTGKGKVWSFSGSWRGSRWQPEGPRFNGGFVPSNSDLKAPYTGKK